MTGSVSISASLPTHAKFFALLFLFGSANYGPNKDSRSAKASTLFPPVKPHAPNTILRPSRQTLSTWGRQKQWIWSLYRRLQEPDSKYAIKSGTGTAILALPAFIESTRPWFLKYRGEWALISFFVGECLPHVQFLKLLTVCQLICKSCRKRSEL